MKSLNLRYRNIAYFMRIYRVAAAAVLIAVAVIAGSLAVGDSVRSTLVERVAERLGDTESIVFSRNSFINEGILNHELFGEESRGVLLVNGFISTNGTMVPVNVWGVDNLPLGDGEAMINNALAEELSLSDDNIVLRLPSTTLVPSGSLFVTKNYTTSLRLSNKGVATSEQGGNIGVKNEQIMPLNIFVKRDFLARTLDVEGKINMILSSRYVSEMDLNSAWNYGASGLSAEEKNGYYEVTSDRIFIQEEALEKIVTDNEHTNRLFSYLINSIEGLGESIPYSFATAMDDYKGERLRADEIILSDYAANRMGSKPGDTIHLTYYRSQNLKKLTIDTLRLVVSRIVPIEELVADKGLSADFPGLSDVESCTDWNSDLPIDMSLIGDEDERYWNIYRSTPKAIIPYGAVAANFSNPYGSATSVRIESKRGEQGGLAEQSKQGGQGGLVKLGNLGGHGDQGGLGDQVNLGGQDKQEGLVEQVDLSGQGKQEGLVEQVDLGGLQPSMFGIQVIYPREAGMIAARSGVDFSSLFLALGIFVIISALLLMSAPLSEMYHRRRDEISLLGALGYPRKRIIRLLWLESLPIVVIASILGVAAGLLYTSAVMWLLGTLWRGATQTSGFSLYINWATLLTSFLVGAGASMLVLRQAIIRSLRESSVRSTGRLSLKTKRFIVAVLFVILVVAVTANLFILHSTVLFVVAGVLMIVTGALGGDYLLEKKRADRDERLGFPTLIWSTLYANRRQTLVSFCSLAAGVFVIFSVGLNRKGFADSSQIATATGGYALWGESSVPIYHDMTTRQGREKLGLTDLPEQAVIVQFLRYGADDASCLNLNKVSTPTVLGADMAALATSDFRITRTVFPSGDENAFEQFSHTVNGLYPALVDETVLQWSLGMSLGDTLMYKGTGGDSIAILLAGTLSNSILQGNIVVDRELFRRIWSEDAGSEVFMVKVGPEKASQVKKLLEQALYEYGVRLSTTNSRLKQFNAVTDTYLTIFMTLGGIGLLLGIFGLVVIVRKNLVMRRYEIRLYSHLAFDQKRIEKLLYRENVIVPLAAILLGAASSVVSVSMGIANTSVWVWLTALVLTVLFVCSVSVFVRRSVRNEVRDSINSYEGKRKKRL